MRGTRIPGTDKPGDEAPPQAAPTCRPGFTDRPVGCVVPIQ